MSNQAIPLKPTDLQDGQKAVIQGQTCTIWVVKRTGNMWYFRPAIFPDDNGDLKPFKPDAEWRTYEGCQDAPAPAVLDNFRLLGVVN